MAVSPDSIVLYNSVREKTEEKLPRENLNEETTKISIHFLMLSDIFHVVPIL